MPLQPWSAEKIDAKVLLALSQARSKFFLTEMGDPIFDYGVVGIGVGIIPKDNGNGDWCIRIYVTKPPEPGLFPPDILDVPVLTVTSRAFEAAASADFGEGIVPQTSAGSPRRFGTLGCLVEDVSAPPPRPVYLLSANHVIADNRASAIVREQGSGLRLASVSAFVPLQFNTRGGNLDCAIARLDSAVDSNGLIPKIGAHLSDSTLPDPNVGDRVAKYGASTQLTEGSIVSILLDCRIIISVGGARRFCYFQGMLAVDGDAGTDFSAPGDSGALLFTTSGGEYRGLGLLIGGPTGGTVTLTAGAVASSRNMAVVCPFRRAVQNGGLITQHLDQILPELSAQIGGNLRLLP